MEARWGRSVQVVLAGVFATMYISYVLYIGGQEEGG